MLPRHRKSVVVSCLLSTLLALTVRSAAAEDIRARCENDQLTNVAQALERNLWAAKCGYFDADPQAAERTAHTFSDQGMYLVFTGKRAPEAPIDRNAACVGGFTKLGFCFPGCYTPSQKLSFGNRFVPIEEAMRSRFATVTTLSPASTAGQLQFDESPVDYFTSGQTQEEIFVIRTEKGRELQVTRHHPLVDGSGTILEAHQVRVGTPLLDQDGKVDFVASAETRAYQGLVLNVAPKSLKKQENIIVAEELLTGSHRFQSLWAEQYFRLDLRSHLDVAGL